MKDSLTDAARRSMLQHIIDSRPKIALYTKLAELDETTERYHPQNEVRGDGYQAGGIQLEGGVVLPGPDGSFSLVFHSPVWQSASITARGALLYLADDGGLAVRTIDFGRDVTSTNGPFTVKLRGASEGGVLSI